MTNGQAAVLGRAYNRKPGYPVVGHLRFEALLVALLQQLVAFGRDAQGRQLGIASAGGYG